MLAALRLSAEDIERLLKDSSGDARAETAEKIAGSFDARELSEAEREIAEDIFRIMARDAEVRVREALSRNLKDNPFLPRDVALRLVRDVDTVCLPVIRCSEVLTDEDLIEIVRSQGTARQVAVAGRRRVSEAVSAALVDTENADVVSCLMANRGARVADGDLERVVTLFADNDNVKDAMVLRPKLPVAITERLLTLVSERMREELAKRHDVGDDMAADLILQARERAVIGLSAESDGADVGKLVSQLLANGRLTPSLMIRALCMGDLDFFEIGVAQRIGISPVNAHILIHDAGSLGLETAFKRAEIPEFCFPAVRAAIDVAKVMEHDGGDQDRARYSRRMIERILSQYGEMDIQMAPADVDYLLEKMANLPSNLFVNQAA